MSQAAKGLGLSGRIAARFQDNALTPLLAIAALLLGLFAVLITPREEEPQIDVTFANVFLTLPGASVDEMVSKLVNPAQQVMSAIEGMEHVYAVTRPSQAIVTAQFAVGVPRQQAIVALYNQIYSNQDWLPPGLHAGQPLIKPMGIDDVPILALTLWSEDPRITPRELSQVAHQLETELKRVPGTRDIYTLGAAVEALQITLDPLKMAAMGQDPQRLAHAIQAANQSMQSTAFFQAQTQADLQVGQWLTEPAQFENLVVGLHEGRPVYLSDVATVHLGSDEPTSYVWHGAAGQMAQPAVTLAIAKQPGTNAVVIADEVLAAIDSMQDILIPEGMQITVTRNYGETANAKAQTLIMKLVFVTAAVVILVGVSLGHREAIVVGAAVIVTLMLMLFASWAFGFTLNRVSLFALIFSIGILVDDAIVVVENIHRHVQQGGKSLKAAIPLAVDEVGAPTILATFAVIAALLPMAFVSGLMGPYMSPIPINASMGMLLSLGVAYILTPWMMLKSLQAHHTANSQHLPVQTDSSTRLERAFVYCMRPFVAHPRARTYRWLLLSGVLLAIVLSVLLVTQQRVLLKMLPFDNKSELQIVVDLPVDQPLAQTAAVLDEMAVWLETIPEIRDYQAYVGTASPINFNGLVRQYYLRDQPYMGDIQVNLVHSRLRQRSSHAIAMEVRDLLTPVAQAWNAELRVVEVPPGPPVQAPIVAEIYGFDPAMQSNTLAQVRQAFTQAAGVVDISDSQEAAGARREWVIDTQKAALMGLSVQAIIEQIQWLLPDQPIDYLREDHHKYPVPIRLTLAPGDRADSEPMMHLRLRNAEGTLIPLRDVATLQEIERPATRYHKNLHPVMFVTADMAGPIDSPLYGMFDIVKTIQSETHIAQRFITPPELALHPIIKWDGEWQVTFETFRDMGMAYAVGIILIYLLVVAQFRSYGVPLLIMAPIPLTIIGVLPGHALLQAPFTATSMIGMIALAGIIVRNSILLVDCIEQAVAEGMPADQAVIQAAIVRARPIVLTALAAMVGALFILDDPIFNGLAVALIFGILVSTLLTLWVIPILWYAFMAQRTGP